MTRALFAAIDATWPAAELRRLGPWVLRRGAGGGKRVSAATADGPVTADDIAAAEAAMADWGQPALYMIRDGDSALDATLAARGLGVIDPTVVLTGPAATVGDPAPEGMACFTLDAPLAIMREIWAAGGIGPARLAVMARASGPATWLFSRQNDRPAGAAFCAIHDDIAMLHALEVPAPLRRQTAGASLVRGAAAWAADHGATSFATLTVAANAPALALFSGLGMTPVAQYHYRGASAATEDT